MPVRKAKLPSSGNYSHIFLAVAMFLFALGLNGSDIGLPEFMTTKRLGLAVVSAGLLAIPFRRWRVPWELRRTAFVLMGIGTWGLLGTLLKGTDVPRDLNLVLAWFLTAYGLLAGTVLFGRIIPDHKNRFMSAMVILGALAATGSLLVIARVKGPDIFSETFALRIFLEEEVSTGLNRLLNGLFFLTVLPLAFVLQLIKGRLWIYLCSLVAVVAFTFLALVSGARQSLAAQGLLLLTFLFLRLILEKKFARESVSGRGKRWLTAFLALAGITLVVYSFVTSDEYGYSINRRVVEKTTEQSSEGQVRLEVAEAAWKLAWRNPVFGLGPGEFADHPDNFTGEFPHNGYTGTMVEYGFFPLAALLLVMLGGLKLAFRGAAKAFSAGRGDLFTAGLSFCLVFVFWMMVFNDLTREYFFWVFLGGVILCGLPGDNQSGSEQG